MSAVLHTPNRAHTHVQTKWSLGTPFSTPKSEQLSTLDQSIYQPTAESHSAQLHSVDANPSPEITPLSEPKSFLDKTSDPITPVDQIITNPAQPSTPFQVVKPKLFTNIPQTILFPIRASLLSLPPEKFDYRNGPLASPIQLKERYTPCGFDIPSPTKEKPNF